MGELSSGCWECGKDCINVEFCSEGASFGELPRQNGFSLPRDLKVTITANPEYWGFSGVLTSGYVTFNQGHYDYFEGFDEDWIGTSTCSDGSQQISANEKRPDVTYRSVYDPDSGVITHYDGLSEDSYGNRGGAVSYLINRQPGQVGTGGTEDKGTCPEIDPPESFKLFPENFGWANKIHFDTSLYKNLTSAWRMIDYSACYDTENIQRYDSSGDLAGSGNYSQSGVYVTCSGKPKQNIGNRENYFKYFDPAKIRVTGLNVLETGIQDTSCLVKGCFPDGHVAGEYAGEFAHNDGGDILGGYFRASGLFDNIKAYLVYRNWANSGELVSASGLRTGQTILLKADSATQYDNFYRIAKVEHFPAAFGVPYDYTIIDLAGTYGSGYVNVNISGAEGSWSVMNSYDPNTCCGLNAYGVDARFKNLNCETIYHSDFRRVFNDSKFKLQSNREPSSRYTYDYGTVSPHAGVSGAREDKKYIGVTSDGNPSGEVDGNGYTPYFPKQLPYFGTFYDVDLCDNVDRGDVKLNTTKARNATCFTKQSTLEVYPDCLTQYVGYTLCDSSPAETVYKVNRVPRLSFVYRGCNYHDSCTFDESGRPYSEPTGIEDLRRGRGGEEIHMFINLGEAWASTIKNCGNTDCTPGELETNIYHIGVESPVTFPSFPDFDLEPTKYGCDDQTFQLAQHLLYAIGSDDAGSSPDPTSLSGSFCSEVPQLAASCDVRQPYTTYGYIMNLCGMQDMSRRGVMDAFNNLTQSGTCNHLDHVSGCSGLVEPFYRGFTVPAPFPYSTGDFWQATGLMDQDVIIEKTGETVGYWGLRDVNGALVAPYYRTEEGVFTCPGNGSPDVSGYINFSDSGNYIDGWPTSGVPFLIQIETETRCVGCATSVMDTGNLTVTIDTLPTKFLHQITHAGGAQASTLVGGMYGYQHCNYGDFALDTTDAFSCASGFPENTCLGSYTGYNSVETIFTTGDGDKNHQVYGIPHSGETCSILSGVTFTLNSRLLGSSSYGKGWYTGTTNNPFVEIYDVAGSTFIMQQPAGYRLDTTGFTLYGRLGLGCIDMNVGGESSTIDYSMPIYMNGSTYLDIANNDAVRILFGGQDCPAHYPARLSNNRDGVDNPDLNLYGEFWAVATQFKPLFEALNYNQFEIHKDTIAQDGRLDDVGVVDGLPTLYNMFGLCSGDKVWKHGCFLESGAPGVTMGTNTTTITVNGKQGMFFGVSGAQCDGSRNVCNTCSSTDWPNAVYPTGDAICDPSCTGEDAFLGIGAGSGNDPLWGIAPRTEWNLNNCYCLCEDPVAFAYYEVTGSAENSDTLQYDTGVPLYAIDVNDPTAYWYSISRESTQETGISGLGPFLNNLVQPTNPIPAFDLGGISPEDWFSYSHGVNKLVTGIQHDLVPPKMVINNATPGEGCDTLTVKTCETGYDQFGDTHAGCSIDPTNRVNSANCKNPIHNIAWNDSYTKTNVEVQRKACFPETMIVNKIECKVYNNQYPYFDLWVSREYYSHDRTWKVVKDLGDGNSCYPYLVGAYLVPYSGVCSGCTPLPYAVPSDLVTPVYETPCSIHPSTGAHVNQDFVYSAVGISDSGSAIGGSGGGGGGGPGGPPVEEPGGPSGLSACSDGVPAATGGDDLWNYFNLFYYTGWPHDGVGTSPVFGIYESGAYIPKLSQTDSDGNAAGNGVCPSAIPLDTFEYNYNPPHDSKMLATGLFAEPSGLFGILETNSKHSCLQDVSECGGELWCNKIFFPRRSYVASTTYVTPGYLQEIPYSTNDYINGDGTLIAPFGVTAMCLSDTEKTLDRRYYGWGLDGQFNPFVTTSNYVEPDYIKYEINNRFFDVCDDKVLTEVYPYNVGIDDSRVSVRDYLPLIGVIHPGWRSTVASKNCVILSTGCNDHYALPTHTDQSIRVGAFAPKTWSANRFDAMGYYLDKAGDGRFVSSGNTPEYLPYRNQPRPVEQKGQPNLPLEKVGASGADDCLFNPFKILVDVECSTNRIKRLGIETDEPTSLSFISEMPGGACGGFKQTPPCGCSQTECADNLPPHRASQERVMQLKELWELVEVDCKVNCSGLSPKESGLFQVPGSGNLPTTFIMERCVTVALSGGVWQDPAFSVTGQADSGCTATEPSCNWNYTGSSLPTGLFVYAPKGGNAPSCTPDKSRVFLVGGLGENTSGEYTNYWECANHLYIHSTEHGGSVDTCNKTDALCDAEYRFPLPLDCTKCYIGSDGMGLGNGLAEDKLTQGGFTGIYNEHPTTGWFVSDCGCEFLRQQDSQCTNSIVKMTITE